MKNSILSESLRTKMLRSNGLNTLKGIMKERYEESKIDIKTRGDFNEGYHWACKHVLDLIDSIEVTSL